MQQTRPIYFMAKAEKNAKGTPTDLPPDRCIKENAPKGLLTISYRRQLR